MWTSIKRRVRPWVHNVSYKSHLQTIGHCAVEMYWTWGRFEVMMGWLWWCVLQQWCGNSEKGLTLKWKFTTTTQPDFSWVSRFRPSTVARFPHWKQLCASCLPWFLLSPVLLLWTWEQSDVVQPLDMCRIKFSLNVFLSLFVSNICLLAKAYWLDVCSSFMTGLVTDLFSICISWIVAHRLPRSDINK